VDHREERVEGGIDLFAVVVADAAGGSLGERTKVVGLLETVLGHPSDATVDQEKGGKRGFRSKIKIGDRDWTQDWKLQFLKLQPLGSTRLTVCWPRYLQ
jgi:hypothetical protein